MTSEEIMASEGNDTPTCCAKWMVWRPTDRSWYCSECKKSVPEIDSEIACYFFD